MKVTDYIGGKVKPPNGVKHKALANAEDGEIIDAMKSQCGICSNQGQLILLIIGKAELRC